MPKKYLLKFCKFILHFIDYKPIYKNSMKILLDNFAHVLKLIDQQVEPALLRFCILRKLASIV